MVVREGVGMTVIHIMVSGENRRGRESVAEMVTETLRMTGLEVEGPETRRKPNPWAVIRGLPEVAIRVEVRP